MSQLISWDKPKRTQTKEDWASWQADGAPPGVYMANKYNARKTTIDGITFDSGVEATRYSELRLLERAGLITDLECQPKYTLQGAFVDAWGRKHRAVTYTADFCYIDRERGVCVVEDVKGGTATQTQLFKVKFKWAQRLHPDERFEVVT